jgi:hypothetical protein
MINANAYGKYPEKLAIIEVAKLVIFSEFIVENDIRLPI